MEIREAVQAFGRLCISLGVIVLLFVAYQLWFTNVQERTSQRDAQAEVEALFDRQRAATTTTSSTSTTTTAPNSPPTTVTPGTSASDGPPPPKPKLGDPFSIIRIPKLGVEKAVFSGVRVNDLKKGPGHYPETPLPGQPGNVAIAGHRTTYGAPFQRLDELAGGDEISVETGYGTFVYTVHTIEVVRPTETGVLQPTNDNRLTLTTCHPKLSARERLIVVALLKGKAAPASLPEPTPPPEEGEEPPDETDDPVVDRPDTVDAGLSGDPAARTPALLWGLACLVVWIVTARVGKRWRKVPAYALGTPVFFALLLFFFENVARLLPANV